MWTIYVSYSKDNQPIGCKDGYECCQVMLKYPALENLTSSTQSGSPTRLKVSRGTWLVTSSTQPACGHSIKSIVSAAYFYFTWLDCTVPDSTPLCCTCTSWIQATRFTYFTGFTLQCGNVLFSHQMDRQPYKISLCGNVLRWKLVLQVAAAWSSCCRSRANAFGFASGLEASSASYCCPSRAKATDPKCKCNPADDAFGGNPLGCSVLTFTGLQLYSIWNSRCQPHCLSGHRVRRTKCKCNDALQCIVGCIGGQPPLLLTFTRLQLNPVSLFQ